MQESLQSNAPFWGAGSDLYLLWGTNDMEVASVCTNQWQNLSSWPRQLTVNFDLKTQLILSIASNSCGRLQNHRFVNECYFNTICDGVETEDQIQALKNRIISRIWNFRLIIKAVQYLCGFGRLSNRLGAITAWVINCKKKMLRQFWRVFRDTIPGEYSNQIFIYFNHLWHYQLQFSGIIYHEPINSQFPASTRRISTRYEKPQSPQVCL